MDPSTQRCRIGCNATGAPADRLAVDILLHQE